MRCPVCRRPMIILELDSVEVDHCTRCGGVWLDAGELAILLGGEQASDAELAKLEPARSQEKPRRCPICDRRMELVHAAAGDVVVDRCRDRHGLWFDRGELDAVAAAAGTERAGRVARLLADVFAAERSAAPGGACEAGDAAGAPEGSPSNAPGASRSSAERPDPNDS